MPTNRVAFVLGLPPIEASLNFHPASRAGRLAQNAAVQAYKADCVSIIKASKPSTGWPEGPLVISYHWYNGRRLVKSNGKTRALRDGLCRPRDRDNAIGAAKPIQDAMAVAGLLPKGDAAGRVRVDDVTIFGRQSSHGGAIQLIVVVETDTEATEADAPKAGGL